MRTPPLILIVDDNVENVEILQARLTAHNYNIITAIDGEEGLAKAREERPDLILLDIMMPKMDGIEVCRHIRSDSSLPFMPIIMVTAKAGSEDIVAGLEAGGDEYLTKPVDHAALVARVKSMLRIKELHDTVNDQSIQLEEWNQTLEQRVERQIIELERVGRLKRYISPQLAEIVVSTEGEDFLESHRGEITVVFCDLRGFTAFSETGEPEEVMGVLREYHNAMGTLIYKYEGTLERFAGDSLMVFFNDPIPCPDPDARAVKMAIEMRERVTELSGQWRKRDYRLGFGVGIAQGIATLGKIGFEGRFDYAAIGTVTNLASRLCDEAESGQVIISQRVYGAVEEFVDIDPLGELTLKGLHRPVNAYNVLGLKEGSVTAEKNGS
jgi:class 3 adenylate cyclase/CheY-like chemotaxis protein